MHGTMNIKFSKYFSILNIIYISNTQIQL